MKEKNTHNDDLGVKVVFENDNFVVINKPAGLAVHSGGNIVGKTLVDWILDKYHEIKSVGEDESRPGIMHRLDMDVSGLMVIAKTKESYDNLKKQFQNREMEKEYTALVHGNIAKDSDVIDFPIKRSTDGHKMAAIPKNTDNLLTRRSPKNRDQGNLEGFFKSKDAITEFKVIKRYINFNLLKVKIKTGRTHQIRVHLYAYGHPLLGDPLYYTKKSKAKNQKINLNRVFLVADKLAFADIDGSKQSFELDFPEDLKSYLPKN